MRNSFYLYKTLNKIKFLHLFAKQARIMINEKKFGFESKLLLLKFVTFTIDFKEYTRFHFNVPHCFV